MKLRILFIIFCFISKTAISQEKVFTHQDTLRGSITKERVWWDLLHYELSVKIDTASKSISGTNVVTYKVLNPYHVMQIDLQAPMQITALEQNDKPLDFKREGNVFWINIREPQMRDSIYNLKISFEGVPKVSMNPPWDDGFTWSKDSNGNPFIATSCQGGGASIWWPCKDHMYDEPDNGITMHINVPENLVGVGNGRLINVQPGTHNTKTFTWQTINPINNYGVNVNVGNYVHFHDDFIGEKDSLDCDYYVLPYHLEKAKEQFKQAPMMLKAFEYWFGPYPFYEDSYKLVEVPYLGMEHQSSVTYGNGFVNGYLGRDLSFTGLGLKFDFIIIHESGHEWFANNITYKDIADMWIHEGFTAYSENLYLDYYFGKEAASEYVIGTRLNIRNDQPIIGKYNVNKEGSGDMYCKGANMLHTLRQLVDDDEKWRNILRGLNSTFYHQTVDTKQIEDYLSQHVGMDLKPFFDQYLRTIKIPEFQYQFLDDVLKYRWSNCNKDFAIPVKVILGNKTEWLYPTTSWKSLNVKANSLTVDRNFYVQTNNSIEKIEN